MISSGLLKNNRVITLPQSGSGCYCGGSEDNMAEAEQTYLGSAGAPTTAADRRLRKAVSLTIGPRNRLP